MRKGGPTQFLVRFLLFSLGWSVLFWMADSVFGLGVFRSNMFIVAVVSVQCAAVGFSVRRKLTYVGLTLLTFLLIAAASEFTGLAAAADAQMANGVFPVFAVVRMVAVMTAPFVFLLLFVGRNPQLLWERRDG